MAAPTFVAEYETAWNTTTTPKTASVTTAVGDVLVMIGITANTGTTLATPTGGTGLTWTLRQSVVVTDYCNAYVWTATATTGETFTCSVAANNTNVPWGFNVLRFSGADGIGASAKTNVSAGAPSLSFTTTGANSAIVIGNGDWAAVDGTTRTWRTVGAAATEQAYFRSSADYTVYVGRHVDSGATGAKTVGLSAPTGQKYSIVAVEVLGSSASTTTGDMDATIPKVTASATGTVDVSGTASVTVPKVTASATGAVTVTGTMNATLPKVAASASGAVAVAGALSATVPGVTATAAGTVDVTGAMSATVPVVTMSATGSIAGLVTGTMDATLPRVTASAVASVLVSGELTAILPLLQVAITGTVTVSGANPDRNLPYTLTLDTHTDRTLTLMPTPGLEVTVTTPPDLIAEITTPTRTLELAP